MPDCCSATQSCANNWQTTGSSAPWSLNPAINPASINSVDTLKISIGRKFEQPLAYAYPFDFRYQIKANQPGFLQVQLTAADGPLGSSNYNIELQMVALDERRSFLHLSFAYSYGWYRRRRCRGI